MKNLKYLKLFEAFESTKLTKTLGYIDQKGRETLIDRLKTICEQIDFPFSQLNDSHFQYLPFKKALDLQYTPKQNPCKATSKSSFGSGGIEGEVCQSGRVKRMWGSRVRTVECPNCGGSGIKPEKTEVKILKFWFNKEGEAVGITGVDNVSVPKIRKTITEFSKRISDYNVVSEEVRSSNYRDFVNNLKTGDFVLAQIRRHEPPTICYVWRDERYSRIYIYLIQNTSEGDTPTGRDWENFGRYSWVISDGDFISIQKLEPKRKQESEPEVEEIDPYSFNKSVSFGWRGSMNIDRYVSSRTTQSFVNKADFALILDLEKLKETEFKDRTSIRREREDTKSGSKLTVKDSDVKKANIARYMQEIAKRSDIVSDISNLEKVIKRMTGREFVLFHLMETSRFTSSFNNLANYYVEALKEGSSDYYKTQLSNLITARYNFISKQSTEISNNLKVLKEECKSGNHYTELKIIEGLENLSRIIYQKISNIPFDCVEDIDIVKSKLDSFKNILDSGRYGVDRCGYFIGNLTNLKGAKNYLFDHYYIQDYKNEILTGIESAAKFLERY